MLIFTSTEFKRLCIAFNRVLPPQKVSPLRQIRVTLFHRGGRLDVTNLDETLSYSQGSEGDVQLQFCIPSDVFRSIRDNLKGKKEVILGIDGDSLSAAFIGNGRLELSFPTHPAENFPSVETAEGFQVFDKKNFFESYRRCSTASSTDATRKSLNSVFYDSREKVLVATDGRMLILSEQTLPVEQDMIIPLSKTLTQGKLFGEKGEIALKEDRLFIKNSGFTYSVKLHEGSYPDYKQVIPQGNTSAMRVELSVLSGLLQEMKAVSKEETVHFHFSEGKGSLAVETETALHCKQIRCRLSGQLPEVISLSEDYLSKAVNAGSGTLELKFGEQFAPVLVQSAQSKSIIMPLRSTVDLQALQSAVAKEGEIPMQEEKENTAVSLVEKPSPLQEIYCAVELLEEKHKEARQQTEDSIRTLRECQQQTKLLVRHIRSYEKDVTRRLKDVRQAEDLVSRLQKLVA